jgi:hypothetical protein
MDESFMCTICDTEVFGFPPDHLMTHENEWADSIRERYQLDNQ